MVGKTIYADEKHVANGFVNVVQEGEAVYFAHLAKRRKVTAASQATAEAEGRKVLYRVRVKIAKPKKKAKGKSGMSQEHRDAIAEGMRRKWAERKARIEKGE
ncbi:hypothetical protein EVB87_017 [Rhizobium phage RHph_N28_1]|nr:hypothetical protein EVB87_017 [Rhizobium phage RHph_N28_1]QIG74045.1 hypothetical protein EVC07_017 [Rhizobium phage RHph_N42]QXV73704.1 hypothetical protein [Rhizobium phage RHph_N46]